MINKDGTYLVRDVPLGEVKVCVSSENPKQADADPRPAGRKVRRPGVEDRRAAPGPDNSPQSPPVPEEILKGWFPIPTKYSDPGQTTLKTTVRGGKNSFDIVLD